MQLRLSVLASLFLLSSAVNAEDFVSVQYMSYDEDSGRTTIHTPAVEINKEFGVDYTLNATFVHDTVSGASPTYYDASSGASAKLPSGITDRKDIVYGNVPYEEKRTAVGITLTKRFPSRDELKIGYDYSDENDYTSNEISMEFLHFLDSSKNSSLSLGLSYQKNDADIYCFLGNEECDTVSSASSKVVTKDLDVITGEIGYTRIIDKTSLIKGSVFYIYEDGYLSNPYMRVVRDYYTSPKISPERKPDERKAYGATLEYAKALSDKLSSVVSYRFYDDDWDITSHTLNIKAYYEYNDKLTIGVGFRGYTQTAAKFFSGRRDFFTDQKYASSDRRVSEFDSYNYDMTLSYELNEKTVVNMGVGYYDQPEYFDAFYYDLGFKYFF